ncbi:hypothetical protein ISF_08998 [Cordyceps fumosorosea ARSEF 2679]|uniref:Uncharacterized protein n=1 Tax=Cordyceps fumosorosea (strain ARSEF 2679) TaxID=1081104 RepID=A0A167LJF8_CORFA|nr:hypothetical protein ISF_08998 [Cordyceps fumosorosea ARSEF 2679]OAA53157.1 hypothetical protein ISF_08998 [Cordyceps fumosorosea ARSEF 2679]
MHWSRVFAWLFFTAAFCNKDSGPAQTIALYLGRKFEEEAGIQSHHIAPNCPAPCEFKDFIQYVSPYNPKKRKPAYKQLDWSKLTDAALVDIKSAIGALHDIGYTGAVLNDHVFPNWDNSQQFSDVSRRVRISISFSKAMLFAKGKSPAGGSYSLLLDYWQAAADLRRKNQANHLVKNFPMDFEEKFRKPLKPELGDPISHPPAASYQQLDLPGTLNKAKEIEGLDAKDVEDFVNNYVTNYNSKGSKGGEKGGKSHLDAIEETQNLVSCNR